MSPELHGRFFSTMEFPCTRFPAWRLAMAMMLGAAGCDADPVPLAPTEPACNPRSSTDPARLNIDSSAEGFGTASSCRATLQFSIARNTDLRALAGTIRITGADGPAVGGTAPLSVSLTGPEGGMFRGEQAVAPIVDRSCRQTSFILEIERCAGGDGDSIRCPEVRVRPSRVLRRLEASGDGVSVCYDD